MMTPLELKLLALSIYGATKREKSKRMETVVGALLGVAVGLLIAWWIK